MCAMSLLFFLVNSLYDVLTGKIFCYILRFSLFYIIAKYFY